MAISSVERNGRRRASAAIADVRFELDRSGSCCRRVVTAPRQQSEVHNRFDRDPARDPHPFTARGSSRAPDLSLAVVEHCASSSA